MSRTAFPTQSTTNVLLKSSFAPSNMHSCCNRRMRFLYWEKTCVSSGCKKFAQHAGIITTRIRSCRAAAKTSLQQCIGKTSIKRILGLPGACSSSTAAKSSTIFIKFKVFTQPLFLLQRCMFGARWGIIPRASFWGRIFSATRSTCGSLGCRSVSLHTKATCVIAFRFCFLLVCLVGEGVRRDVAALLCRTPGGGPK